MFNYKQLVSCLKPVLQKGSKYQLTITFPGRFLRNHFYPTFRGNSFTKQGKENEPQSVKCLVDMEHVVKKSGMIVKYARGFLQTLMVF